jgi:hypothetical protein
MKTVQEILFILIWLSWGFIFVRGCSECYYLLEKFLFLIIHFDLNPAFCLLQNEISISQ